MWLELFGSGVGGFGGGIGMGYNRGIGLLCLGVL